MMAHWVQMMVERSSIAVVSCATEWMKINVMVRGLSPYSQGLITRVDTELSLWMAKKVVIAEHPEYDTQWLTQ